MTHTYKISGMTCTGCQAKVEKLLTGIEGVNKVVTDLDKGEAEITMGWHIPTQTLQEGLKDYPKYQLTVAEQQPQVSSMDYTETKSWLATYKPLLLIASYLIGLSLIISNTERGFDLTVAMRVFMGGFFLVFSFFKMLDLNGFAESYAMYDLFAKQVKGYGYIYPFIELMLGIAFITHFNPVLTNATTIIVMGFSSIGVIESVLNKKKIRCACLGAVFNLPMTTVTIVEDLIMVGMAAIMLIIFNI